MGCLPFSGGVTERGDKLRGEGKDLLEQREKVPDCLEVLLFGQIVDRRRLVASPADRFRPSDRSCSRN